MSRITLFFLTALMALPAAAQTGRPEMLDDDRIMPHETQTLQLKVDNMFFFKDNEYDGNVQKGYSLPGVWIRPRLTYQPTRRLRLEVGLHALAYHGANKYPNYAYQDIGTWKGSQYQRGAHVLPFLRAQLKLKHADLVFGDIYGQSNHRLVTPLYDPELDLTSDPEAGFQAIVRRPHTRFDVWINWQSYQFETDTHQEVFTLGMSDIVYYNAPHSRLHVYSPIQLLGQHRGGEQDTIAGNSVQTLVNGAVGLGLKWNARRRVLRSMGLEADVVGSYQQSGQLWPHDAGVGVFARASVQLSDFGLHAGYFYGHRFVSLYGNSFFSTLSTKTPGTEFIDPQTAFFTADYAHTFARHYTLGFSFNYYYTDRRPMRSAGGDVSLSNARSAFSAGVYFKASPSFVLKRFEAHRRHGH